MLFLVYTYSMATDEIHNFFAETLTGDYEDDAPWQAVRALRSVGSREVFDYAAEWCNSEDALKRSRGLDVLAQLGKTADHPSNSFPEEAYSIVVGCLERKEDVRTLSSGISALGHLNNPLAIPLIAQYCTHASGEVRFSVAFALGEFPNDRRSVEGLLLLMDDTNEDVRDWATFAMGTLSDSDSPRIREVLFRRLADTNVDVHEEAMAGLCKRRDERVLPILIRTLENPPVSKCVIEACCEMLNLQTEPDDWTVNDYVTVLHERFVA